MPTILLDAKNIFHPFLVLFFFEGREVVSLLYQSSVVIQRRWKKYDIQRINRDSMLGYKKSVFIEKEKKPGKVSHRYKKKETEQIVCNIYYATNCSPRKHTHVDAIEFAETSGRPESYFSCSSFDHCS